MPKKAKADIEKTTMLGGATVYTETRSNKTVSKRVYELPGFYGMLTITRMRPPVATETIVDHKYESMGDLVINEVIYHMFPAESYHQVKMAYDFSSKIFNNYTFVKRRGFVLVKSKTQLTADDREYIKAGCTVEDDYDAIIYEGWWTKNGKELTVHYPGFIPSGSGVHINRQIHKDEILLSSEELDEIRHEADRCMRYELDCYAKGISPYITP